MECSRCGKDKFSIYIKANGERLCGDCEDLTRVELDRQAEASAFAGIIDTGIEYRNMVWQMQLLL